MTDIPIDLQPAVLDAAVDEAVGEQETADSIRAERDQRLSALSTASTAMFAVTAGYVLAFLALVLHLIRGTLAYVSDANEAVSGEFLV